MTREEAKELLTHMMMTYIPKDQYGDYDDTEPYEQAIDMAIEALSAEAVQVVRCKDCRYQEHCHETVAHTKEHDGFREHWSETIEWCSRGERKGGEDE